jgi:hypothetical protein
MEPVPFLGSYYNNVSWGLRQKENKDAFLPYVIEPDENAKPNRNWARLIQKIYEVDPLTSLPVFVLDPIFFLFYALSIKFLIFSGSASVKALI